MALLQHLGWQRKQDSPLLLGSHPLPKACPLPRQRQLGLLTWQCLRAASRRQPLLLWGFQQYNLCR